MTILYGYYDRWLNVLAKAGLGKQAALRHDPVEAAEHFAMKTDPGSLSPPVISGDRLLGLLSHALATEAREGTLALWESWIQPSLRLPDRTAG